MSWLSYLLSKWLYGTGSLVRLIEELNLQKGSKVLNLGCGIGKTVEYLVKKLGVKVVAGDIFEYIIEAARRRALKGSWASYVDFIIIDREAPYFGYEEFDGIVCETLTSFIDHPKAADAYFKALKPSCKICLIELVWHRPAPKGIEEAIEMKFKTKLKILTDEEWRALFHKVGLRLEAGRKAYLSLTEKAVEDFRYDAVGNVLDLIRTFEAIARSPEARRMARDFIFIYKEFSKYLGLAEYVYSKRA